MMLNLKLSQKGLLLISGPLIFELCFVAALAILQWQAQQAADAERRSKLIAIQTEELSMSSYDAGVAVVLYGLFPSKIYQARIQNKFADIDALLDSLTKLVAGHAKQAANVAELRADFKTMQEVIASLKQQIETKQLRGTTVEAYNQRLGISHLGHKLEDDCAKVVSEELKERESLPLSEGKARTLLLTCLLSGVAANIAFSIWLSIFFSKNIVARVNRVVTNTDRLTQGTELLPITDGKDEIAHLDQAFHAMAARLEEAARKEREIEKLKQEFVAMISHDLRTPLASISVCLEMLSHGVRGPLPERALEDISDAQENTKRLIGLVTGLLDLERMDAGNFELALEKTRIGRIIDRSISAVAAFAKENNVELKAESEPDSGEAFVDEERLVQVLVNLISNAVKFSPAHSTVSISAERHPHLVKFKVKDQGRGLATEKIEEIFQRFKQVDRSDAQKGTGLGLAICKAIIERHGGTIGVDSDGENKGCTFWFNIPQSQNLIN